MKLGLQLGYWGGQPPTDAMAKITEADRLGFDAVFTAESWGSDCFTPLAWWGSHTLRIKLGTSIVQLSARTPTATAMAALTLDHLSSGRLILGLGVSGPQVVEGWYGQPFGKPLARTREYVDIVRQVFARQTPVTSDGPHYPLPYRGPNSLGLGKPLRPIVHPLRADLPIWLGAEGPKNVALCAEIADGWLPLYYAPRLVETYRAWLGEGFARPGARRTAETFEIATNCNVVVTDDVDAALNAMKPGLGFYVGGMGARDMNFHKDLFARMGYEKEADEIQRLFFEGKRDEAIATVPSQAVDDISLVGPAGKIRDALPQWEEAGVTTLVIGASSLDQLRTVAEVILTA
ncbi:MAG TPA: LLM class F420-dependent oxidoreductase [Acidimicrobiales bacterium]|nr:LLM class F420-dependent oxidoreductase [Acidimicrobiales bacterium]